MLKTGRIIRGYLGVQMFSLTPEIVRDLRLPDARGTFVNMVLPGSPAERAGLHPGDVIRSFNGRAITDIFALRERVAEADLHTKIELGILRGGRERTVVAEIVEAPAPPK